MTMKNENSTRVSRGFFDFINDEIDLYSERPANFNDRENYGAIFWLSNKDVSLSEEETDFFRILAIIGIALNIFVFVVCLTSPKLSRQRATRLIISLTLADLVVCGALMLAFPSMEKIYGRNPIPQYNRNYGAHIFCRSYYFICTVSCTSSSLHICAIALDRNMFIVDPLRYHHRMSGRCMNALIVAVWLFSVATGSLVLFVDFRTEREPDVDMYLKLHFQPHIKAEPSCDDTATTEYTLFMVIVALYIPSFLVMVLYLHIYSVVRSIRTSHSSRHGHSSGSEKSQRSRQGDSREHHFGGKEPSTSTSKTFSQKLQKSDAENCRPEARSKRPFLSRLGKCLCFCIPSTARTVAGPEGKAMIVLSVIVGTYLLCWMPFAVLTTAEALSEEEYDATIKWYLLRIGYSNSCINPIIYAGLNQVFRNSVAQYCVQAARHNSV